ncbi:MAG: hypothetical protein LBQ41_00060 [Candidatus Ancillula sp.]|jgi:hypothetical protein|nr:hypothetical protein [Candidatus Ancillula sp.]
METPLWILAISQLIVDVLLVVLLVALIALILGLKRGAEQLGEKAGNILDEATDAIEYVRESRVSSAFKLIFSPKNGFKYWRKQREKERNRDKY